MNRSLFFTQFLAQRALLHKQANLRWTTACSPLFLSSRLAPRAKMLGQGFTRSIQTVTKSAEDYAKDRSTNITRPKSPFYIYRVQLTSSLSFAFRISGVALTVLVYAFGITAVFVPMDVAAMTQFISELPSSVVLLSKVVIAAPFSYHFWNGIRHLIWDTGRALSLGGVYRGGYAVLAATAASTLLLSMI